MTPLRIGIDVGGTKIEGIAIRGGEPVARDRVPTPRNDYAATIDAIASLVSDLERRAGSRGTVGVGIPGAIASGTGLVKNANSVWLIGRPLRDDLEARLARDVRVANDANCFAVSEATDGAAAGAQVVFGVIVGTGTGAGLVIGGHALTGANGVAGEWGHNPLPWPSGDENPGPACYCGKHGCIETFLSGPGMQRDHLVRTGERLAPEEIVERAYAGDPAADATVTRYEHRMARALASVINVLDPDVIVLGGGMSNIERLYTAIPRLWSPYVFSCHGGSPDASAPQQDYPSLHDRESKARIDASGLRPSVTTRLARARFGDASGVRGAAWLWAQNPERDA